ncbi:MAG: hypothetical protein H7146_03315, partial [Burkholderiaceae bacterium]|nr:hypothetical protein [Microbacteriaceae bacterium]
VFEPDAANHAVYDDLFADFSAIRESVAEQWPRLAASRSRHSNLLPTGDLELEPESMSILE